MITAAQSGTMNRIRTENLSGDYEIAATDLTGNVLQMFFSRTRVSVFPNGSFASRKYGTERIGRFGTFTVNRPVDLLE